MILSAILASVLTLGQPVLAPMQWTRFAVAPVAATEAVAPAPRFEDLAEVDRLVNAGIEVGRGAAPSRGWRVWPRVGWCGDFALTKRAELLRRGWPGWALRIAVVGIEGGSAHAVLLVQTERGWMALDQIAPRVTRARDLTYRPVMIQGARPDRWYVLPEFPP